MPLTLHPRQVAPIWEWISNAKSSAEAPLGKVFKSPFGVKTKISCDKKLSLNSSRKSTALGSGFSKSSLRNSPICRRNA